jgi:hypothetical protein
MKKSNVAFALVLIAVLLIGSPVSAYAATPTIAVTNPPPNDIVVVNVGQAYTFDIAITSDEPFVLAIALGDEYYPGRGIFFNGNDTAHQATSATLHLTLTGKESTADLPPAEGWPAGVAPASVVVGVRYAGGVVVSYRYRFGVIVP